jgi:pimeloyl-ACP methyl ester carboxylesterase
VSLIHFDNVSIYYRTREMAEDVICLLDYLGWTADRELNIVGTSLGGMIAQGQ